MDKTESDDWAQYRVQKQAFPEAAERGRLLAASRIAGDPDVRKRMEDAYGVDFCKGMYPEAYRTGFIKLLDRVKDALPW